MKTAKSLVIQVFQQHSLLLGIFVGLLLTVGIGVSVPDKDLHGDSRFFNAIALSIFLVPGSIATAYAGRHLYNNIGQLPLLRRFWLSAIVFFSAAIAFNALNDWSSARRYAREGQVAQGTVLETHPENHDRLLVAYTISNVSYRTLSSGPRVARSYNPGNAIPVYYYSSAPAAGFCIEPEWQPGSVFTSWMFAAGIFPLWLFALLAACEDVRAWAKKSQSPGPLAQVRGP